jgi:hypothetical protein
VAQLFLLGIIRAMWVKRTNEEITAARRRNVIGRIRGALFMCAVVVILFAFVRGGGRSLVPAATVSLEEAVSRLPRSLFYGIIAGLIFYCFPGNSAKNMVCPKCKKVTRKVSQVQCSCGGHLEDAETMKWV